MKKAKKPVMINAYSIIVGIVLLLYTISVFFPLLWGFMTSLKYDTDLMYNFFGLPDMSYWQKNAAYLANPENAILDGETYYKLWGMDHLFANYTKAFTNIQIVGSNGYDVGWNLNVHVDKQINGSLMGIISNTFLLVIGTSVCAAAAPCIAGYLCAKFKYKFSTVMYSFVIFVMSMPLVGTTTSLLMLLKRLSLYDTIYGMWLRSFSFSSSYFLIFYAFFKTTSDTYSEAAQIDGASQFRIMWSIYIPLASKIISTIFLLQIVAHYNEYTTCLYFLPSYPTLSYAIWFFQFSSSEGSRAKTELIATSMMLSLPMLIVFIVFKNKLMGNISLGGVKE